MIMVAGVSLIADAAFSIVNLESLKEYRCNPSVVLCLHRLLFSEQRGLLSDSHTAHHIQPSVFPSRTNVAEWHRFATLFTGLCRTHERWDCFCYGREITAALADQSTIIASACPVRQLPQTRCSLSRDTAFHSDLASLGTLSRPN